jgi:hypothetical protein
MQRHWSFGLGTTSFGIGLNVLLAIVKHPPAFLYGVAWGLIAVGIILLLLNLAHMSKRRKPRQRNGDPRTQVREVPKVDRPVERIGIRNHPGAKSTSRRSRFGSGLDVGIENMPGDENRRGGESEDEDSTFG